jgi:hypothetical protein
MGRPAIDQLIYLMDEAFDAGPHSLLANLSSLRDEDWHWQPEGGGRSAFEIVQHVGECKYVYDNHAFGDRSMHWGMPKAVPSVDSETPPPAIIGWLRDGQRRLKDSVAALQDDDELLRLRWANWKKQHETRWLATR